ncbi:MAG: tetratricopeptide repeat protein [Ignavibacteriaceae bacterium]|nr:tetratricopeptide repeat protein [Ignavibacteriaceae bacterium]
MKQTAFLAILILFFASYFGKAQQTENNSVEPMDPKAATYYNSAVQFMKTEQYEDALKSLDSSLSAAKDYRIFYLQGQANLKLGRVSDARNSFNECTKLNSNYDMGWMASGNANLALKEYDLAINDFKKVVEVSKDVKVKTEGEESIKFAVNAKSIELYNKGNELNKQSKFEEAIQLYDQAFAIVKDPKYLYQKGLVLSKLTKNKEAEEVLKSSVALNDSFDIGYVALASLQIVNKDYNGAIKSYEKAMLVTTNENIKKSIPESISKTYLAAGNNAFKDKKYDQSIDWMLKSISNSPSDAAYFGLAKAYIEKKKYNDAVTALDNAKSVQKTVTDEAIAYYKGMIHLNKGEDSKAVEFFTVAVKDATYKKAAQAQLDYLKAKQKGTKK